uniref:Glycosyltransferase family 92 protein n=1 Tax=Meloidogyne enterolobii TaxID=390850 RepID=A0A6V7WJ91_MELEN|nr:unnamed protein product [Meloidogyne enterolobii]
MLLKRFFFLIRNYIWFKCLTINWQSCGHSLEQMILNKTHFQKVRRIITRAFLLGFLFILCITFNMPWSTQHIAIISTNYFFNSSSYPSNTMVVLFNAQRRFWPPWPLLCHSHNATHSLTSLPRVRHAFTPILICGWFVSLFSSLPNSSIPFSICLARHACPFKFSTRPYRKVSAEHLPVVACFSPLFFNERWQLIIPTLEIYRQYGVSLQVFYIQSMLVEILDFMRIYENEKIIRIEAWTKFNISMPVDGSFKPLDYDPNAELEWRCFYWIIKWLNESF